MKRREEEWRGDRDRERERESERERERERGREFPFCALFLIFSVFFVSLAQLCP